MKREIKKRLKAEAAANFAYYADIGIGERVTVSKPVGSVDRMYAGQSGKLVDYSAKGYACVVLDKSPDQKTLLHPESLSVEEKGDANL